MRITFDVSAAVHHHAGLGRYAQELLTALTALDHANEYRAFYHAASADERPEPPLERLPARRLGLAAKPWRLSVLLADFAGLTLDRWLPPADLFHATEHLLPPLPRMARASSVKEGSSNSSSVTPSPTIER